MMHRFDIVLVNPILTRFRRSRLRRADVMAWLILTLVFCLLILLAATGWDLLSNGMALNFLMGLQAVVLVFLGGAQVSWAIGSLRESGIIDAHRVSPLPPSWLAVGLVLGAPMREYAMCAVSLPFAILMAILSDSPGFSGWLEFNVILLTIALVAHVLALLSGLLMRKPKLGGRSVGVGFFLVILCLWITYGMLAGRSGHMLPASSEIVLLFGLRLPWLVYFLLIMTTVFTFAFLAATRRLQSDQRHAYSKPQALAFMTAITTIGVGTIWNFIGEGSLGVVVPLLYVLVLAALVLGALITPTQFAYVRGVRRALRRGGRRPSSWEDDGTNRLAIFALCAIVFLGTAVSTAVLAIEGGGGPKMSSQAIALGVFVVAYFGLAYQYFLLRLGRGGGVAMVMFLFLIWLMPLLISMLSLGQSQASPIVGLLLGLSPITGLAMSSGADIRDGLGEYTRLFALAPAITFAVVFNVLLVGVQRRIDHHLLAGARPKETADPFEGLLSPVASSKPSPRFEPEL